MLHYVRKKVETYCRPCDMASMPAVNMLAPRSTAIPHDTSIITSQSTWRLTT